MLGDQYFINRLYDIYDYSAVRYIFGDGELQDNGLTVTTQWELVVPIYGEAIFIVSTNEPIDLNINISDMNFNGISNSRIWDISVSGILIYDMTTGSNPFHITMKCAYREIRLVNRENMNKEIDHIEGLISNFDFIGSEMTSDGTNYSLNQIRATIHDREIIFRTIENIRLVKEQIKSKRIDRALLSTINIPIKPN